MKTKIILLLLILLTISLNSQWVGVTSGTSNFLTSVQGISATNNYAAGFAGTVLRSTNAGQTWTVQTSPAASNINSISFPPTGLANTGWAGAVAGLFKTTNNGINWTQQITGAVIADVFFSDLNTGLALVGRTVRKTTNGGTNFTSITYTTNTSMIGGNIVPTTASLLYILAINSADDSSYVFKSTNGGDSWSQIFRTSGTFFSIAFINTTTGLMGGNLGILKRTTNGGTSWSTINSGTTKDLLSVKYASSSVVYISGETGTILKSTNGGLNWISQVSNTTANLGGIFVYPADDFGFAVGSAGIIVRTTNGGVVTGFVQNENEVPQSYSLQQNYPNPFNPSTNIKFSNINTGIVQIKVYDLLGKERATIVNQSLPAGTYKVDFDASELPSGTYFYRLTAGNYSETKKMILVK